MTYFLGTGSGNGCDLFTVSRCRYISIKIYQIWKTCICNRWQFLVYVISGFCAAFAGLLLSSRIQTGQPAGGEGYELDAITAAVIGGASLSGGKGSVFGSFIGILVVGILTNGLDLLNVSSYYQQIIKGAIILLAVMADRKKD